MRPTAGYGVRRLLSAPMRAVVCEAFGPPEALVVMEVDDPTAGDGQLLMEVKASAVTFPDTLMLEDKYQFHPAPPYIPGGEAAGVVVAVGDGVSGWSVGDRVVGGLGTTGGYASLLAIPAATRVGSRIRSTSMLPLGCNTRTARRSTPSGTGRTSSRARRCSCSVPAVRSACRRWKSASSWAPG